MYIVRINNGNNNIIIYTIRIHNNINNLHFVNKPITIQYIY